MAKIKLPPDIKEVQGVNNSIDSDPDEKFSKFEIHFLAFGRILFLVLAFLYTATIVTVYLLHLLIPPNCRWLVPADLSRLEGLAISIIVGVVISGTTTYFFRKKN